MFIPHPPVTLLVGDDSRAVHHMFEQAVARYSGFPIQYIRADDGGTTLKLLSAGEIDLAFIDVFMPEMSGLDVLGTARVMGNKTFVTLMSGQATERAFELARELRAYEFLIKPFTVADIEVILKIYERVRRNINVLIVDDSMTARSIIHRVLNRSVFRIVVEEAVDGNTALALCRSRLFEIVFLDCNMPGLNGLDTLDQLHAHGPNVKIVMISAERDKSLTREAFRRGARAFLYKPFHPNNVDTVLHQLFELTSPQLRIVKPGVLNQFDVSIVGRMVQVTHNESGHVYRFVWFRDAPYLREARILADPGAQWNVSIFRTNAEKAAIIELRSNGLLENWDIPILPQDHVSEAVR